MDFLIDNWNESWDDFFASQRSLLEKIDAKLSSRGINETIFPKVENVFRAFQPTDSQKTSVVILGQDPYHGDGEAMGLSFSVPKGVKLPPSLKNIFKELSSDLGSTPTNGDLTKWASQNVLLLNSILTVAKNLPASHSKIGWQDLTDRLISYLSATSNGKVFVLWGNFAQSKRNLIDEARHAIIQSPHPSPLSANKGFFGSRPFSRINGFLKSTNQKEINWNLE